MGVFSSGDIPKLARRSVFPESPETMDQVDARLRAMVAAASPVEMASEQTNVPVEVTGVQVAAAGVAAIVAAGEVVRQV